MQHEKELIKLPTVFVFLSFLAGLFNFLDTFLRLLFSYMLPIEYPLKVSLKPLFFVSQALCFMFFIYYTRSSRKPSTTQFQNLINLQLPIFATTIFLFFLYELAYPGGYGILFYTDLIWLISYIAGLSITSFWFASKLRKERNYQLFFIVFLLIGLAFLTSILSEIYLWPQTLFNFALPPLIDNVGRLAPPLLMVFALLYTWIYLTFRKRAHTPFTLIKFSLVTIALLLPFFLNNYKEGLINMIIRAIIFWGLGYSGHDWYYASLYLAAITVYLFLVKDLSAYLNRSVASSLIILGVISFPWNGIMVFEFGYSSILGNMLSIDALIAGFSLLSNEK